MSPKDRPRVLPSRERVPLKTYPLCPEPPIIRPKVVRVGPCEVVYPDSAPFLSYLSRETRDAVVSQQLPVWAATRRRPDQPESSFESTGMCVAAAIILDSELGRGFHYRSPEMAERVLKIVVWAADTWLSRIYPDWKRNRVPGSMV